MLFKISLFLNTPPGPRLHQTDMFFNLFKHVLVSFIGRTFQLLCMHVITDIWRQPWPRLMFSEICAPVVPFDGLGQMLVSPVFSTATPLYAQVNTAITTAQVVHHQT